MAFEPFPDPEEEAERLRKRRRAWRLLGLGWLLLIVLGEWVAHAIVARPNRLLRRSPDPDVVYATEPGLWFGRTTYDLAHMPVFMIFDLLRDDSPLEGAQAPPGYVAYRIDQDGCRTAGSGNTPREADVVLSGSSNGFGILLPYESSLGHLLEGMLAGRDRPPRVANCSTVGHHLVPALRAMESQLPAKNGKVALFVVRPWHMYEQFDYTRVLKPRNELLRALVDRSYLARLIFYAASIQRTQFDAPLVSPEVLGEKLDRYRKVADAAGARSLFFLMFTGDETLDVTLRPLEPLLAERGFDSVRLWVPNDESLYIDPDRHWSHKGAQVTAAQMLPEVSRILDALVVEASEGGH